MGAHFFTCRRQRSDNPALAWHAWLLMVDARFAAGERAAVLDHGADWSPLRIMMKP
jgi:hypothetical protein